MKGTLEDLYKGLTEDEIDLLIAESFKVKKDILKQKSLNLLTVGSAWESIPVYCEVTQVHENHIVIEDEYRVEKKWGKEDFISRHRYWLSEDGDDQ